MRRLMHAEVGIALIDLAYPGSIPGRSLACPGGQARVPAPLVQAARSR
jgi:hypothetical protein